jgi:UDP-N-acetylglucosamine acyltransferase
MPIAASAQIHPSAILTGEMNIGENVRIGPYAIIDGPATIGADTIIGPHAHIVGPITMGRGNKVGSGAALGSDPQHLSYEGQPTRTEIGDYNVFREHCTVHRGSHVEGVTIVGNHNYLMVNTHIGHDSHVGNHCVFANGALVAGHCRIHDHAFLSGNVAIHQFVRLGRYSFASGQALVLRDLFPFMITQGRGLVSGVNVVALRRAGFARTDIDVIRRVYQKIYRTNSVVSVALQEVAAEYGSNPVIAEMIEFTKGTKRGLMSKSGHSEE